MLAPFAQSLPLSAILLLGFVASTNLTSILLPARDSFILLSATLIPILPAILYLGQSALGPVVSRTRE